MISVLHQWVPEVPRDPTSPTFLSIAVASVRPTSFLVELVWSHDRGLVFPS